MNVRPCALIVEDELFVALDLEDAMVEMGFYVCGVAATQERRRLRHDRGIPGVQGGQEGIEAARCLREACRAEVVFVTGHTDRATLERIHEEVPGAPVLTKPISHARLAEVVAALV